MADFDVENDVLPALAYPAVGNKPTIAALKAAIAGSGVAASYSTARMMTMTKNDLIYVCRLNGIAVAGI